MTPEVRRAALRMAAKTALVFSLGCSGGGKTADTTQPSNTGSGSATPACPAYLDSLGVVEMGKLAADDPLHDKPGVYGAFADIAARSAARTQECCTSELVESGSGAKHRWECCSAIGDVPAGAEASACTPWGPPCPPAMA